MSDVKAELMERLQELRFEVAELCVDVGWCKSKTEARKAIKNGAIKLGDFKVSDPFAKLFIDEGRMCIAEHMKSLDTLSINVIGPFSNNGVITSDV